MSKKISLGDIEKYIGCILKYKRISPFTKQEETTIAILEGFYKGAVFFKHIKHSKGGWSFGIGSIQELFIVKIPLKIKFRNLREYIKYALS